MFSSSPLDGGIVPPYILLCYQDLSIFIFYFFFAAYVASSTLHWSADTDILLVSYINLSFPIQ